MTIVFISYRMLTLRSHYYLGTNNTPHPRSSSTQLCDPNNKELAAVGEEMRRRLIVTRNNVQRVTGSEDFSNGFQLLKVTLPLVHVSPVLPMSTQSPVCLLSNASRSLWLPHSIAPLCPLRNPYVDPLNVLQAEIMKRLRVGAAALAASGKEGDKEQKETKVTLEDALIVSVNGIAQGMKNSG
jgi:hypothetical protein